MQTRARGQEDGGIEAGAAALVHRLGSWVRWLAQELVHRHELLRQRRALLELDDHLLKDIGLRREDALREADRLLWHDALGPRAEMFLPRAARMGRRPKKGTAPWARPGSCRSEAADLKVSRQP